MNAIPTTARLAQSANEAAQVLQAERDALEGVAYCERQMRQLAADSHAVAERVRRRTEARIERLRQRMTSAARQREDRIAAEMAQLAKLKDPETAGLAPLDQAIARTIEEIVGGSQSS